MKNERRLTDIAFALAVETNRLESRKFYHVTLGLYRRRIVVVGTNKQKTSPVAKQIGYKSESIHSELSVLLNLQRLPYHRDDVALVNFCFARRYLERGVVQPRNSKPCKHCATFVSDFASMTYYVNNVGWITV